MRNYKSHLATTLILASLSTPVFAAMGDDPLLAKFMLDKFETTDAGGQSPLNWELDAWAGKDLNKVWLKSAGERLDGETEQSNELLFSRGVTPFWDFQIGVRQDRVGGITRDYLSIGAQGLAPYLFDTSTAILIGDDDQVGLSAQFEYELMLTQRWVLSPEVEVDFWSEDDSVAGIGSGLSSAEIGLRLSYAIRREIAPYIGISWGKKFGNTADFAIEEGEDIESAHFVAGLRIWF